MNVLYVRLSSSLTRVSQGASAVIKLTFTQGRDKQLSTFESFGGRWFAYVCCLIVW